MYSLMMDQYVQSMQEFSVFKSILNLMTIMWICRLKLHKFTLEYLADLCLVMWTRPHVSFNWPINVANDTTDCARAHARTHAHTHTHTSHFSAWQV